MDNSTLLYGKSSVSGGGSSRTSIDSALLPVSNLCKIAVGMCRRTRWTTFSAAGSGGMRWRNALHRFVLQPRWVYINRISVTAPATTVYFQGHQLKSRCLCWGVGEAIERSKGSTTYDGSVVVRSVCSRRDGYACSWRGLQKGCGSSTSSEQFTRIITAISSYRNNGRINSRGLSTIALQSRTSSTDSSRRGVISSNLAPISAENYYSASYRKQGCAGSTLRFVYNSISDRWCVVQKPPGWSMYAHPSRPSVTSVLQPLLDASIASRGCNLVAGGLKENSSGLPGAAQRSQYKQPRKDSCGRPLLPRGMLREMELETAAQDELRGLYFPFQLDADAQGLILVATDAQMNALLCHLLNENFWIRREFRVLSDVSRLLACRNAPGGAGSLTHNNVSKQREVLTSWSNSEGNNVSICSSGATTIDTDESVYSIRAGRRQQKKKVLSTLTALPYFASATHWGWSPFQRLRMADLDLQTPRGLGITNRLTARCRRDHLRRVPATRGRESGHSSLQGKEIYSDSEGFQAMLKRVIDEKTENNNSIRNTVGDDIQEKHENYNLQLYRRAKIVPRRSGSGTTDTSEKVEIEECDAPARTETETDSQTTKGCNCGNAAASHQLPAFVGQEAHNSRGRHDLLPKDLTEEVAVEIGWSDCFPPIHKCLQLYDFFRGELLAAGKLVSSISQRHAALRSLMPLTDPVAPPSTTPSQPPSPSYSLNKRYCFSERTDAWEESNLVSEHFFRAAEASCLSGEKSDKQLQALSRRALLQLLDGSFLTASLAGYFCRNALGQSICRVSAPTTHPLHLDSFTQQKTARWAEEQTRGAAAGQQLGTALVCATERGIKELGRCHQDQKTLACTNFVLMSTHRRRLTHGVVRTLGLYRVSLQAGAQRTHQIRVHFSEAGAPLANDTLYNPRCNASLSQRVIIPYALDSLAEDESLRKDDSFFADVGDDLLLDKLSPGIQSDSQLSVHSSPKKKDINTELPAYKNDNTQMHLAFLQSASDNVPDAGPCSDVTQRSRRQSPNERDGDPNECFSIPLERSSLEKRLTTAGDGIYPLNESSGSDYARSGIAWNNDSWTASFTIDSPDIFEEVEEKKCNKMIGRIGRWASCPIGGVTDGSRMNPHETDRLVPATAATMESSASIFGSSLEDDSSSGLSVYPDTDPTEGAVTCEDTVSAAFNQCSKAERDDAQVHIASSCSEKHSSATSKRRMTRRGVIRENRIKEDGRALFLARSEWKQDSSWNGSGRVCDSLGLQLFRLVMPDPLHLDASTQVVVEIGPPPEWGGISD